ncbi:MULTISPECIES: SURF1 family cytochrome oxidase biogenesis protein [unclassified Luteococcus]|uniref:SURF1 family cytochrome oxidase biogenesis protein n=1 Tax=unclassified Luteococcus TaxID=2639923 RepID=UPI00313A8670
MKKLWLRWIGLVVFVVLLGALFIRLGEWQMHRLDWRRETNARVVAYQQQPVKPYQQVFTHPIADDEQWQRVTATGTFDAKNQIQAMYRSQNKESGSEVVTPLHTDQGEWLLVNRGFIPRAQGANEVAVLPDPPSGKVTVTGYVRRSEHGKDQAITPQDKMVRLINAPAIGKSLNRQVLDGYVGLTEITPPQSGNLKPMPTPELDEGPHLSYAIQWFCFTAIAVAGAVVLIRSDLRDRKKAQARRARREQAATGQDPQTQDSITQDSRKEDQDAARS